MKNLIKLCGYIIFLIRRPRMSRHQINQLNFYIESNFSTLPLWALSDECIYIIHGTITDGYDTTPNGQIIKIGQAPKGMLTRRDGLCSWLIKHGIFEMKILAIIKPNDALMRSEKYIHSELSKLHMNVHLRDHFESRGSQETYEYNAHVLNTLSELIKYTSKDYWMNTDKMHAKKNTATVYDCF